MALQVWLPLNGNLNNQGLTNWQFTNNNATIDNNGKIGKCYAFSGSSQYLRLNEKVITTSQYSISFWMYATDVSANHCILSTRNVNSGAVNIYLLSAGIRFDTSTSANWQTGFKPTANTWYHITLVQDATKKYLYVNGVLNTSTADVTDLTQESSICTIGCEHINGSSIGTYFAGKLNDFRIYDHALSAKEVEVLSRGLVCHYPLSDISNQTPNNVATYPTFDTSLGHGGWAHWGNTGNLGHYSQNTDSQYIFRHGQTYSHCFSDESTATAPYLLYQSPSFSGGYRSLCAIIKEENGAEIKESIVYPVWNAAVSGSIPSGKWTSITPLGDGFYLGKVEGFQQDGSNNLVGLYVRAGYKVYVSEFYIENDRKVCSDFFYPSTTVYDTSGYQYNGIVNGTLTTSNDTARYSVSTVLDGDSASIQIPNLYEMLGSNGSASYSISVWTYKSQIGTKSYQTILGGGSGFEIEARNAAGTDPEYVLWSWGKIAAPYEFNKWNHMVFTRQGSEVKLYVNGVLANQGTSSTGIVNSNYFIGAWNTATQQNYEGQMSDFRLYATALSAEQVAELYNTAVSVANNGTLMGYELVEV